MEPVLLPLIRGVGEAPVFTAVVGRQWTPDRLMLSFREILVAAGPEGGGVDGKLTTHSIRPTAATWAPKAEVPLDRISGILGHKDSKMVLRYAHLPGGGPRGRSWSRRADGVDGP